MKDQKDCSDSEDCGCVLGCTLIIIAYMAMITTLILTGHSNWAIGLIVGLLLLFGGGQRYKG